MMLRGKGVLSPRSKTGGGSLPLSDITDVTEATRLCITGECGASS